jgi:hypothetical protein
LHFENISIEMNGTVTILLVFKNKMVSRRFLVFLYKTTVAGFMLKFPLGKHFKRIVIKELKNVMQRATCKIHAKASTFRRKWIFAQSVDK